MSPNDGLWVICMSYVKRIDVAPLLWTSIPILQWRLALVHL